jgi:HK97 family phage prohead protease
MREYKTFAFKADVTDGLDADCFQGYAATFNGIDSYGDMIQRGAFAKAIAEFLEDGAVCWQHDWMTPIGKPLDLYEDATGLFIKGKISQTIAGKDALILLRDGVVKKMSIGYSAEGCAFLTDEQGIDLLGEDAYNAAMRELPWYRDQIRLLTQIKLYEVSLVTVPADNGATVTGVKDSSSLAGLTLDDHFQTVHAAEQDLIGRLKSLAELRQKDGRPLSEANRTRLATMAAGLKTHVGVIDALLAAGAPPSSADTGDVADGGRQKSAEETEVEVKQLQEQALHELARFQRTVATLH